MSTSTLLHMRLAVSVSVAKRTNSLVLRLLVCVEFQRSLLGVLRSVSSALVLSGVAVCLQAPQRQGHSGFCNPGPAAQQSATDATGAQRPQRVLGCVSTLLTRVLTPHARAIPPVRPPLQFLTLSHTTVTTLQPHHLTILRVFITAAAA